MGCGMTPFEPPHNSRITSANAEVCGTPPKGENLRSVGAGVALNRRRTYAAAAVRCFAVATHHDTPLGRSFSAGAAA